MNLMKNNINYDELFKATEYHYYSKKYNSPKVEIKKIIEE